jgi:hypothetical protein
VQAIFNREPVWIGWKTRPVVLIIEIKGGKQQADSVMIKKKGMAIVITQPKKDAYGSLDTLHITRNEESEHHCIGDPFDRGMVVGKYPVPTRLWL